jgi:hypothetical protein
MGEIIDITRAPDGGLPQLQGKVQYKHRDISCIAFPKVLIADGMVGYLNRSR